ncbi:MAG: bifunctional class I SAM-dependent methyltransferase/glycosyltransferase family 2 protein [Flavobacteriales bacterium]|nr:bifunctional class I SAM-dependent methyltransferase/glycosyltransferase family 2 protein [Flavobacteriales bacterium]MCX7769255.1 bifunctional class I SAM-dependent methyltransferase/glycosyltransferase family 2 protein [Flavobacteriales bacterium]MDW8410000.1 glycosyltransferase [Flavobacteriales bacterium]
MRSRESPKAYFDRIAKELPRRRRLSAYYWSDCINYANFFIHAQDRVLEIGCANGDHLAQLKGSYRCGIDYSLSMIEEARRRHPDLHFIHADAQYTVPEEKFDVIVLMHVIGWVDDVQRLFENLHRCCHSRTRIIIGYYNHLWEPIIRLAEFIGLKPKAPQLSWLSRTDIENLLYLAGFEAFRSTRRMLVPLNVPILSYIANKFLAPLPFFNALCLNKYINARPRPSCCAKNRKEYSVSVVIPARNESGNIENAIRRIPPMGSQTEIIFIEGHSTDDTWEVIQRVSQQYASTHTIKIGRQSGKGKGDAVRTGFSMASGDILMILDADLTVAPEDLPKFYEALVTGKGEFINGSRLVYPMEKHAMRFLNMLGNKFFSSVFSWLLEQPIKDTLCGTKAMFRNDYLRLIENRKFFGEFDPFGDFDLLFGAYKLNLKIVDLPVRYRERTYGTTNISRWKHGLLLLRMCLFAAGKIRFVGR